MADFKFSPFRTTHIVQSEIQEFLDAVSMAVMAYQEGMVAYLKEGWLRQPKKSSNKFVLMNLVETICARISG